MIVLRLDRKALADLIESQPEEFKLELSKAVLAEASRMLVRNIIPEQVETIVTVAINEEVAKQIGSVTGSWSKKKVKLNPDVKKEIEALVKDEASGAIQKAYKMFRKTLDERTKEYTEYVDTAIKNEFEDVAWRKIRQEMWDEVERQMRLMRQ